MATKKKEASIKEIIATLIKEKKMEYETEYILESSISDADEYISAKKNQGDEVNKEGFEEFCFLLNFLDPKSYDYIRNEYEAYLPDLKDICELYVKPNGEPGLTEDAFKKLKAKREMSDKNMVCALIVAEIPLNAQSCSSSNSSRDEGLINFGCSDDVSELIGSLASGAYIFLLVSLNEPWEIPVAYFLVGSLNGAQKANLIRTVLYKCHNVGVDVVSLTLDRDDPDNWTAIEILGCNYGNGEEMKTTFTHPCVDSQVAVFFDVRNLIRWARLNFQTKKLLLSGDKEVNWGYVKKLKESKLIKTCLQRMHQKFVFNIQWPTELLGRDVAKAIEYCRLRMKHPDYIQSEATEKFIMTLNDIIDIFEAESVENKKELFTAMENIKKIVADLYIKVDHKVVKEIKKDENSSEETNKLLKGFAHVLKAKFATEYRGLLISVNSLTDLCENLIETKKINSLNARRISRTYFESFFGAVFERAGKKYRCTVHNNVDDDVNALRLKRFYGKIVEGTTL